MMSIAEQEGLATGKEKEDTFSVPNTEAHELSHLTNLTVSVRH